ncbi:hypothetical protein HUT17_04775 (plasmid) [Nocardiopsis flavescens]|nr:hypothetical protein HUT17_04775 [Nocardiopsis flavescens]
MASDSDPVLPPPPAGDQCGLSRCRRPLPARVGRGPRYEYCPDRRWEATDGKTYTCNELGRNERAWEAVFGSRAGGGALAAELTAALAALAEPLDAAAATVKATRHYLTETVAENDARTAAAEAAAADATGRAEAAEALQMASEQARQQAEEKRSAAEQRTRNAEADAERARRAAAADRENAMVARGAVERLDAENTRLHATVADLQGRLNAEAARAERATTRHQVMAEEADRLRTQLEETRSTAAAERDRFTAQAERLSTDYAVRLDDLQQAHTAELERLSRNHAELLRQAGRADALAERLTACETERDRARAGLEAALRALTEQAATDQVRALLQDHLASVEASTTSTARRKG